MTNFPQSVWICGFRANQGARKFDVPVLRIVTSYIGLEVCGRVRGRAAGTAISVRCQHRILQLICARVRLFGVGSVDR